MLLYDLWWKISVSFNMEGLDAQQSVTKLPCSLAHDFRGPCLLGCNSVMPAKLSRLLTDEYSI